MIRLVCQSERIDFNKTNKSQRNQQTKKTFIILI